MSKDKLRLTDYMQHIRDAIERVDKYVGDLCEVDFLQNDMVSDAVIRNYEVIGEACHNIERDFPEFANSDHSLPLKFAYEMRNAISHGYYKVDLEQIWESIHQDLPDLHEQIVCLIHQEHAEIFAKATTEAIKQFPNDIVKQNATKHEIAESMGLTKQEISDLLITKSKGHDSGLGI